MTASEKEIRESIRRIVAHLAREHTTKQDVIWKHMYQESIQNIKP